MPMKTILVALNEVEKNHQIMRVAAELAQRFNAHVIGLYVIPAMDSYPDFAVQWPHPEYPDLHQGYVEQADCIKSEFEEEMRRQDVRSEWRVVGTKSARFADGLIEHGLQSDLIIAPQRQEKSKSRLEPDFVARIVMESGRPVLIIPAYGNFENIGKQVLVAWNGTRESARSVFDAIPLMKDADNVTLAWLNAQDDLPSDENLPGSEMAVTLARHDIQATSQSMPVGDLPIGEALLSHASDLGADLLVMGAYGHSRLREFVFGGATRTILDSMTLPILMSR